MEKLLAVGIGAARRIQRNRRQTVYQHLCKAVFPGVSPRGKVFLVDHPKPVQLHLAEITRPVIHAVPEDPQALERIEILIQRGGAVRGQRHGRLQFVGAEYPVVIVIPPELLPVREDAVPEGGKRVPRHALARAHPAIHREIVARSRGELTRAGYKPRQPPTARAFVLALCVHTTSVLEHARSRTGRAVAEAYVIGRPGPPFCGKVIPSRPGAALGRQVKAALGIIVVQQNQDASALPASVPRERPAQAEVHRQFARRMRNRFGEAVVEGDEGLQAHG